MKIYINICVYEMRQYSRSHVKEICAELMLSMFRYKDEQKVQIKKNASRDCYHKREKQQKDTPHQINKTNQNKNKERKITTTKKCFFLGMQSNTLVWLKWKQIRQSDKKNGNFRRKNWRKKKDFQKKNFIL